MPVPEYTAFNFSGLWWIAQAAGIYGPIFRFRVTIISLLHNQLDCCATLLPVKTSCLPVHVIHRTSKCLALNYKGASYSGSIWLYNHRTFRMVKFKIKEDKQVSQAVNQRQRPASCKRRRIDVYLNIRGMLQQALFRVIGGIVGVRLFWTGDWRQVNHEVLNVHVCIQSHGMSANP